MALPQAPEARRLDRHPETARAARDRVLDRVAEDGVIPADEVALAKRKPVPRGRKALPALAPPAIAVRGNPPRGSGLGLRRGPARGLSLQIAGSDG